MVWLGEHGMVIVWPGENRMLYGYGLAGKAWGLA